MFVVRLKRGKTTFEVMVEEGQVAAYREGKVQRQDDVVTAAVVWTNASQGTTASDEQLMSAFETTDIHTCIDTILRTGDAQESAGERKAKLDGKRQEIIAVIQKTYVAADGKPLPLVRIENALEQIKPRIDVDVDATRQVTAMASKLAAVMPMKKGSGGMGGTISVPAKFAGAAASSIRKHATVLREVYGGSVKYDVEIANYDLLMKDLAKVTKGEFEIALDSQYAGGATGSSSSMPPGASSASEETTGGRKKKKKGKN